MPEIDRREFLKLVGVSAGGAAAAGCADRVESLIPYVVQPEEITPGKAVVYASTCRECPAGCGLHVRTREGRPIKVEGNPDHPINRGGLCPRAQASVGRAYSPDRFRGPMRRSQAGSLEPISWDEAIREVAEAIRRAPDRAHVLGGDAGHTAGQLLDRFVQAARLGGRTVYEPLRREALREATRDLFGVAGEPVFDLADADLILDFGSEMLEAGTSPVEHQRQWAEARDVATRPHGGARLVAVGPRLSLTASSSDEWLPARAGSEGVLALALARAAVEAGAGDGAHEALLAGVLAGAGAAEAAEATGIPAETITRLGRALARAERAVALPPGAALSSRRAVGTNTAVLILNQVVGAVGRSVLIPPEGAAGRTRASFRDVLALIKAMEDGRVGVLLIHDSNPVYSLPKSVGFEAALAKAGLVVSFASSRDETAEKAHLVLPDHTALESWGDVRTRPGVRSIVQPTLRPLFDSRALGDTLLGLGRALGEDVAARLPSGSFRRVLEEAWADTDFRAALQRGGVFRDPPATTASFAPPTRLEVVPPKLSGDGDHTLVAFPTLLLYDGRTANLPWMQETPDPVTSVAWESWGEISLATAERLGIEIGDVIAIETSAGRIEVSAYPRGGIRDDVVAVPIGQGHTVGTFASRAGQGLPGVARGANVTDALPAGVDEDGGRAWLTERARVSKTGRHRRLPMSRFSDNQRGRQLAEAVTLAVWAKAAGVADEPHGEAALYDEREDHHDIRAPFDPADDAADEQYARKFPHTEVSPYRWGMTVDLDRCTGCSACVVACYVENNIPIVGEEEVRRVRPMAWLRIDRYVGRGEPTLQAGRVHPEPSREKLGEVDIRNAPMLCQQCGSAPCEPVCPVIATYHNDEGLNAMIYNRCIGTRYCANNCPYKVRRFNYFDNQLKRWPSPMELGLNPDVTVRGQGVMEKCTFCIQRIQEARQHAKHEGRLIADGEVRTACQQTCPSRAIHFGNLRDPQAEVTARSADPTRAFSALHVLNTRPAVIYLAKVLRGKVEG
jgi:anaerobic selenocysteine-containing dehydrogenase/Fe-S-cluster-containing dehydrogenase component